jgi:heme/copper-type cytochrome/quinol oxidase subunit 1
MSTGVGRLFFAASEDGLTPEFFSWTELLRDSVLIFYVALPAMVGIVGNLCVPKLIGAGSLALRRWNQMAFWLLWIAFGALVASFLLAGWRTPDDTWSQWCFAGGKSLAALSWLVMAISQLATVSGFRREGMTAARLPLTVWGLITTNVLLCVVLPLLLLAQAMQVLDASVGTSLLYFEETVPTAPANNGMQSASSLVSTAFLFPSIPGLFALLLPSVGLFYDHLRPHQTDHRADRLVLYAMLGIGALALASSGHEFLHLAGGALPSSGPLLLPARLIVLPLAVLVGRFVVASDSSAHQAKMASTLTVAFVMTLVTGGFFGLLLSVEPVGSYLRATYAADALRIGLLMFGAALTVWCVVYDRFDTGSKNVVIQGTSWVLGPTLCIGVPAIWWIWFSLGAAGLPNAVADPGQYDAIHVSPFWQQILTAMLVVFGGLQFMLAAGWMIWFSVRRVLPGKSSS